MFKRFLLMSAAVMLGLSATAFAAGEPKLPEPAAPQHASIAGGRIDVYIGSPRASNYQIGDSIPVNLVFILKPNSMVQAGKIAAPPVVPAMAASAPAQLASPDSAAAGQAQPQELTLLPLPKVQVEGLKMGQVSGKPSDIELLGEVTEKRSLMADGTTMVVDTFFVTTYVTTQKTQIGVAVDFMYAVNAQPDGQPNWTTDCTPELPIGITKSATDNQVLIVTGDQSVKESPRAQTALWLMLLSLPFGLPMVAQLLQAGYRRLTRGRDLSANERTWQLLDAVVASAGGAFEIEHYRRIFYAIREHFNVLGMDTTQTLATLSRRSDLDKEAVALVFNQETLFFDPTIAIDQDQQVRLMTAIAVLIPRQ